MAIRKHRAGELVVEQTRELGRVRAMLASAGMMTEGIEWPAACYILAYVGDEAVGVIGVEPKIDAALIRSLYVGESMRRRGIGAALLAAARKAAHTRGARHLYLFTKDAGEFFSRAGFEPAEIALAMSALAGAPQVEFYRTHPEEFGCEAAYHLDISCDGVIER
jgi:N-acetylglutamate synthase-like GNAT family acetyltransferase